MKYISFNIGVELACFLFALYYLGKDRSSWKLMVIFLCLVVITEVSGKQLTLLRISNQWLYNIFLLFEAAFVGCMFYSLLSKRKAWIFYGFLLFSGSYLLEIYFRGFQQFLSLTNLLSSTLFVVYSLYFYYELLQDEKHYDLPGHAPFWWVTGCLFFYFGGTACNIFFDQLSIIKSGDLRLPLRYIIFSLLNFILYSCWSYSFICRYQQRTSYTLSA